MPAPWEPIVVVIVLFGMLAALFFEKAPAYVVMLTALVIVWNVGIISTDEALSGFSNSSVIMIASLFVVATGVEKSHLIERLALRLFANSGKSMALLKLMIMAFTLSAVFNNTPIVFILIPITRDWARSQGYAPSEFLIPLSYTSMFGGCLTIIGTSTNLVVNGLLTDNDREPFSFLEPGYLGAPLGCIGVLYLFLFGPYLLPKNKGGLFRKIRDEAKEMVTELEVTDACTLVGKPIEALIDHLGVQKDGIIKIRRRLDLVSAEDIEKILTASCSSENIKDLLLAGANGTMTVSGGVNSSSSSSSSSNSSTAAAILNPPPSSGGNIDIGNMREEQVEEQERQQEEQEPLPPPQSSPRLDMRYLSQKRGFWDMPSSSQSHNERSASTEVFTGRIGLDEGEDEGEAEEDGDGGGESESERERMQSYSSTSTSRGGALEMMRSINRTQDEGDCGYSLDGDYGNAVDNVPLMLGDENTGEGGGKKDSILIEVSRDHFSQTRHYIDMFPVPDREMMQNGDIVFIQAGSADILAKLAKNSKVIKGLNILDASVYDLVGFGSELVEVVLSTTNPFIGRTVKGFGKHYGASVVAARHMKESSPQLPSLSRSRSSSESYESAQDGFTPASAAASPSFEVATGILAPGDLVMLVVNEESKVQEHSGDFFVVSQVGNIPAAISTWDYGGVVAFLVMLVMMILTDMLNVDSVQITVSAMLVMVAGGWVPVKDALKSVDFPLLALIGASLGFAHSVDSSGLAESIAAFVKEQELPPLGALFLVSFIAMMMTNIVTNNASAALAIPIAISIADGLEVSYKPFAMAVLYSSSIALMSPIGYQTNTMVWGPGGYAFADFMRVGVPLNILYCSMSCVLIPLVFPF